MKIFLLLVFLFGNLIAFEIKENNKIYKLNYEYSDDTYITDEKYTFDDDSEILIKFNEETSDLISEFENKYFFELQEVLITGYYIYKCKVSPLEILPELIEEENIKTAKPNWRKIKNRK